MHILYITYDIIIILYMLSSAHTYIYGHDMYMYMYECHYNIVGSPIQFQVAPLFFLFLRRFKGLQTVMAQIIFHWMISPGLRTWVSPVHQAPNAVMTLRFFRNHTHTQQLSPITVHVSHITIIRHI